MKSLPSDINELVALAEVVPGDIGDARSAWRLLETSEPLLLMLADSDGGVISADDLGLGAGMEAIRALGIDLAKGLMGKRTCRLEMSPDSGAVAVAVRLRAAADAEFAACVVRAPGRWETSPGDLETSLVLCAALGSTASHYRTHSLELSTRVAHLKTEHETLKNSQTHAVSAAIEEREKRLQQQRQDMAQLEAVMKLAADGIITVSEEGVVGSFNEAAARIFGYAPDEVIGQDVALLAPAPNSQRDHEHLTQYLNLGKASVARRPHEVIGKRKDGTLFPLEIAVSVVPLDSGRVLTGIFRDIGDRRRLESQLVQAQKMQSVGHLAAGIAHEINTPTQFVGDNTRFLDDAFRDLAPLLAICHKLCKAAEGGSLPQQLLADVVAAATAADMEYLIDEIPKAISQSLEGVERVAKIVRSMKDFSHPGGEAKQAVDLNRALESTLTVCRNEWKYVAEAATAFDPDLPLVTCLPGECNQVFLNLIINAAHAIGGKLAGTSTEKGVITVITRRDGDWAEIRIGDNGTGIPEEFRAKIFDPFFTTKEVGRGTGQGLAIAHSVITEKHGGTIHFETEIGRGTTFVVRLPIPGQPSHLKGAESEEAHLVRG